MTVKALDDLFHETLKDLYYAEKKLVKTFPRMAKQATSPTLKEAIEAISPKPKSTSRGWRKFSGRWARNQPPRNAKRWKDL